MLNVLKNIFTHKEVNYQQLVENGAFIIDVRTKSEFKEAHIPGSMNIPINILANYLNMLKDKKQPIITCSSSESGCSAAQKILRGNGYQKVYGGGNWQFLMSKIGVKEIPDVS